MVIVVYHQDTFVLLNSLLGLGCLWSVFCDSLRNRNHYLKMGSLFLRTKCNLAFHQIHKQFHYRQANAKPVQAFCLGIGHLRESLVYLLLVFRLDANARVLHLNEQIAVIDIHHTEAYLSLFRELEGVVKQIGDDVADFLGVAIQHLVLQIRRNEVYPFVLGPHLEGIYQLMLQVHQVEVPAFQFNPVAFQTEVVQQLVYHAFQLSRCP